MLTELVTGGLCRLGRDDHPGAVGQLREQRRERLVEDELYRVIVDDLDRFEGADLGLAVRARQGEVALDAELDRGRVHRLAVLELDALAQRHHQALIVVDPMPFGRELRDDLQIGADIDELVAHRDEDDAADKRARERRVENVGVFGETDAQRRLRRRGVRGSRT